MRYVYSRVRDAHSRVRCVNYSRVWYVTLGCCMFTLWCGMFILGCGMFTLGCGMFTIGCGMLTLGFEVQEIRSKDAE